MRFHPTQNPKICWLNVELPWRWQCLFYLVVCVEQVILRDSLRWSFASKRFILFFFLIQKYVALISLKKNSWIVQQTARNRGASYKLISKHPWSMYAGKGGLVGSSQRHRFYYFPNVIHLFMRVQSFECVQILTRSSACALCKAPNTDKLILKNLWKFLPQSLSGGSKRDPLFDKLPWITGWFII